jgi:hypothetical protein
VISRCQLRFHHRGPHRFGAEAALAPQEADHATR